MNLRYLMATILFGLILGASAFSYKDAKNWGKHYPECNGKLQSPMAMDAIFTGDFPSIKEELKFTDFHKLPTNVTVKNTGHTVEIKADWPGKPPRFTGGPLHGNYVFEKTIFRWAQKKEESMESKVSKHLFDNLEKIIHKVQSINSTAVIPPIPLASLVMRENPPTFEFHKGSLDYPPCSESVTWFEPTIDLNISLNMLKGFRKIKLDEGDVSNFRPAQPPNNRQIKQVYVYREHDG